MGGDSVPSKGLSAVGIIGKRCLDDVGVAAEGLNVKNVGCGETNA